jgi:hypothetical protein
MGRVPTGVPMNQVAKTTWLAIAALIAIIVGTVLLMR